MTTARRIALGLTLCCTTLGSAFAQNSNVPQTGSVSTEAPHSAATPASNAHKPKTAAHPKKQDAAKQDAAEAAKKPASTTVPMDFSYIKKPGETETPSSSKSDFDGPVKLDSNSNGNLSPGMKFSW